MTKLPAWDAEFRPRRSKQAAEAAVRSFTSTAQAAGARVTDFYIMSSGMYYHVPLIRIHATEEQLAALHMAWKFTTRPAPTVAW